jgi:hypothetical protein
VAAAWQEGDAKTAAERVVKRNAIVSFASLLERGDLRDEEDWWTGDSTIELEGLLGLAIDGDEIGEPVACRFGRGAEHALLAGVIGSGKKLTETSMIEMNDDGLEIEWTAERLCGPPAQDSGLQCTSRDERGTSDGH